MLPDSATLKQPIRALPGRQFGDARSGVRTYSYRSASMGSSRDALRAG